MPTEPARPKWRRLSGSCRQSAGRWLMRMPRCAASTLRFGLIGSMGIAFALLRLKLRHRLLFAVRVTGPIRSYERSPAYPQAIPVSGTKG